MLKILHRGIQANLDIDPNEISGYIDSDVGSEYLLGLKAGRNVGLDANGIVQLASGLVDGILPLGFLILDAAGEFLENKPAIASGKVSITFGNAIVITDQLVEGVEISPGNKLYCAVDGLITNIASASGNIIGVAGSAGNASSPELMVFVSNF